jgi:hypothetical protein
MTEPLPIPPAFDSIDDVLVGLGALEQGMRARRDRRATFVSAYLVITRELIRRISAGGFADGAWVGRYLVAFADLYRAALAAWEAGDHARVPKPWRCAFEAAAAGSTLVAQDLLLGINAHINHDLPLALARVSIDPDRARAYRDHTAVNDALRAATDEVQGRLAAGYSPVLGLLDRALGPLDEELTQFSFVKAREAAWESAVALANARDDEERARVRARIDDHAGVLARLLLGLSGQEPALVGALRKIEDATPDWVAAFLGQEPGPAPPPPDGEPPVVASLPELVARLEATVARFDAAHSRLSVYPTIYLDVSRRFRKAIGTPGFFDEPTWIEALDVQFANLYFRALSAFEAGRADRIPRCWALTLRSAAQGETTLPQDLMLAINVRLTHDLAIALWKAGVYAEGSERRIADFKKIHPLFKASIDPAQATLAGKYSRVVAVLDRLGGFVDELLVDRAYVYARDGALVDARRLADARSDAERAVILRGLDDDATRRAQRILLRDFAGGRWVVQALRRVEEAFPGKWSEWVAPPP